MCKVCPPPPLPEKNNKYNKSRGVKGGEQDTEIHNIIVYCSTDLQYNYVTGNKMTSTVKKLSTIAQSDRSSCKMYAGPSFDSFFKHETNNCY